jgi:hypothetical protein
MMEFITKKAPSAKCPPNLAAITSEPFSRQIRFLLPSVNPLRFRWLVELPARWDIWPQVKDLSPKYNAVFFGYWQREGL